MKGKSLKSSPVNKEAVRRVAGAEGKKGGGQYGTDTFAARIDSVYQRQGGGRHAQPAPKATKP